MSEKSETIVVSSTVNEMRILGAMINNPENASIGLKLVHEDDFFEPKHKTILKAILNVMREKEVVDHTLVGTKLMFEGSFESVGGWSYLADLAQCVGSIYMEAECEDLKKLTQQRDLLSINRSLSNDLKQGADPSKIIQKVKEKIDSFEQHKTNDESVFQYLLENNSEQKLIEELKKTSPGVFTGFKIGDIEDIKIPGGALTIVAAPTAHGKTTTLINFTLGVLKHHHDKNVYFFTYEESGASITCLFLNTWIGKNISKDNRNSIKSYFRDGDMQYMNQVGREFFEKDKKAFFENLIDKGRLKVFYSEMTAEELVNAIHFIKKNDPNIGMICIDYMQFLKLLRKNQGSRQEELKEICLMLKDCAVETGLPILIAAQFNRTVVAEADLSPTAIGEAGDIERAANMIIGMWNRNFSFNRQGNIGKDGKSVNKEPAIYFEVMKGREIGNGHISVMDFTGNTGKLENRLNVSKQNSLGAQRKPDENTENQYERSKTFSGNKK